MNTIRFGLLGPGNIAEKFARDIQYCDNATLEAVASHKKDHAQKFATKFGINKAYGSYEELLQDKDIDAIYISVINPYHLEAIKTCASFHKPILCEKPIVLNGKDADTLLKLQQDNNVLIMEALWTNFLPTTKKIKEWIQNNEIGEITSIQAAFCFKSTDLSSRLYRKELGGGALYDVGVYTLAFAKNIAGSEIVSTKSQLERGSTNVDEYGETNILFANGVKGHVAYGINIDKPQDALIIGTKGSIVCKNFWKAESCSLFDEHQKLKEAFTSSVHNGFNHEIAHFASLIQNHKTQSDIMPLKKSLECSHLFDEILEKGERL